MIHRNQRLVVRFFRVLVFTLAAVNLVFLARQAVLLKRIYCHSNHAEIKELTNFDFNLALKTTVIILACAVFVHITSKTINQESGKNGNDIR